MECRKVYGVEVVEKLVRYQFWERRPHPEKDRQHYALVEFRPGCPPKIVDIDDQADVRTPDILRTAHLIQQLLSEITQKGGVSDES